MSIRTRKNLNEIAAQVNTARKATTGTTEELAVKEALELDLSAKWAVFEKFMDKPRTTEEVAAALAPVRTAVSVINDEIRLERLEALEEMSYRDAFADYLRTQLVVGYAIDQKDDTYSLNAEAKIGIDAYDMVSHLNGADLNGLIDACCIFADNVAKFTLGDAFAISKNSLHETYVDLRKRMGWDVKKDKMSKGVLATHMTKLCQMLSGGEVVKMSSTDVTYVQTAIFQAKDAFDKAGHLVKKDERTIVRFIFRAMYTRYNGLSYEFQDNTRANKVALTVKNNRDMAEAPLEKDATPEAGSVTSTAGEPKAPEATAETPAPKAKKSSKKSTKAAAPKAEEK